MLLDQTVVSGVGNIYADEALWAARIHPETPARALSTRAVDRLLAEVRAVLEKALAEGGTSFDAQYVNVNGQAGYFAHSLNAYGRTGAAVPALRTADRAGVVHEPVEPLLPALPADAAPGLTRPAPLSGGRERVLALGAARDEPSAGARRSSRSAVMPVAVTSGSADPGIHTSSPHDLGVRHAGRARSFGFVGCEFGDVPGAERG